MGWIGQHRKMPAEYARMNTLHTCAKVEELQFFFVLYGIVKVILFPMNHACKKAQRNKALFVKSVWNRKARLNLLFLGTLFAGCVFWYDGVLKEKVK